MTLGDRLYCDLRGQATVTLGDKATVTLGDRLYCDLRGQATVTLGVGLGLRL